MKAYIGRRRRDGSTLVVVQQNGIGRRLPHVRMHSPDGLNWGYAGQGPLDLALSILVDHLGEGSRIPDRAYRRRFGPRAAAAVEKTRAWALHRAFMWDVVTRLDPAGFVLPARAVDAWLQERSARSCDAGKAVLR